MIFFFCCTYNTIIRLWHTHPTTYPVLIKHYRNQGPSGDKCYGNCFERTKPPWKDSKRQDIVRYDKDVYCTELYRDLCIGANATATIIAKIIGLIKQYWDVFISIGCKRHILTSGLNIDTGSSPLVCCKNLNMDTKNLLQTCRKS